MTSKLAIVVDGAFKEYGPGNPVIENLSMNVKEKTIYSLLGASGCGKTTLLSCIVGLRKLDKGTISVFGSKPGSNPSQIGYMPQDIALFKIFSIREILMYYGRIYGMEAKDIAMRIQFLSELLDLPHRNRRVQSLSGGQGRRVSLACAMFHNPEILILDEPTVGIDPLLRQSIWNHFKFMSISGTTVVITTHYIEEARQSDMIGLMVDKGRMLVEDNPEHLLKQHNTLLLEDIVLQLCRKDHMSRSNSNNYLSSDFEYRSNCSQKNKFSLCEEEEVVGLKYTTFSSSDINFSFNTLTHMQKEYNNSSPIYQSSNSNHFKKITAILVGHYLNMIRHPLFFIAQIILPAFQVFLFNYIMGRDPVGMQVGIVNRELPTGNDFKQYCRFHLNDTCLSDELSCHFLNLFQDGKINLVSMNSESEALKSVENGDAIGFLTIPSNYTFHMREKFMWRNYIENATISGTTITGRMDFSRKMNASILQKLLYFRYLEFFKNLARNCGSDPRILKVPLQFRNIFDSNKEGFMDLEDNDVESEAKWNAFFQPAFILWIIFLLPMGCGVLMVSLYFRTADFRPIRFH